MSPGRADDADRGPLHGIDRREFLRSTALVLSGAALAGRTVMAGPFEEGDFRGLVPADKKLHPDWVRSLFERGAPEVIRGKDLTRVGLPVGGLACGQLYLSGDGRLWYWDIFQGATTTDYEGKVWAGPHYAQPLEPVSAVEQGFAVQVSWGDRSETRTLDARGFADIAFRGEYPIGKVAYRDPALPLEAGLEAFSPFIPLDVESSSIPATILSWTLRNTSSSEIRVTLAGWLENAVCRPAGEAAAGLVRRNRVSRAPGRATLVCLAEREAAPSERRPDVVFERWGAEAYEGWEVEGSAFGKGPVRRADVPPYQGDLGGAGDRVVNSHASAPGGSVEEKDRATGRLTSRPFRISRRFISFPIGGGSHAGKTCVDIVVEGRAVRTATGRGSNRMEPVWLDVSDLEGKEARIRIVDDEPGPWGNVGVGRIDFTDAAPEVPLEEIPGHGSMALSLLGDGDLRGACGLRAPIAARDVLAALETEPSDATAPAGVRLSGALGRTVALAPGGTATVDYVVSWWFPHLGRVTGEMAAIQGIGKLRRHYAARFDGAESVAAAVAGDFDRLAGTTRLWNRTWYDSTLPWWLLDRTFVTVDCLATRTLHAFDDGRWWGWEGVDCCPGTCQHVWQYAQAMARIFPAIERDLRERVDFGLAWHEDGAMDYRAESSRMVAHDGFCGTIVRAWREHCMSSDDAFLRRLWPRVRKSLEFIARQDRDGDGLLEGEQMNTLDAAWEGPMAWISSLYLAALAAGEAMATDVGDAETAGRLRKALDAGRRSIVERLFDGEHFIHVPPNFRRTNTNDGCHIDQMLGQSFALQVGLPRVVPEREAGSALRALWRHNFTPDAGGYRNAMQKTIPGGRWYAMPGEAGLLMCTWPRGGAEKAGGGGNATFVGYFNECMTGFEYGVAAHMIWEGLVQEGLAVTRAIHDRYAASRRNPYNEVECSDHYSRAMMSYGVHIAACGYEHHGPRGHLGFAPRLPGDDFRAGFTAAGGWGTYSRRRGGRGQTETIALRWGTIRLATLALRLREGAAPAAARVTVDGQDVPSTFAAEGTRVLVTLGAPVVLRAGSELEVEVEIA